MLRISPQQWVIISRKLSSIPTAGHEYVFLRLLKGGLEAFSSHVTLVNSVREISEDALPLLSDSAPGIFGSSLHRLARADALRLRRQFGDSDTSSLVFHFYEGGFYEFNLLANLYLAFPDAKFTFNFNLTDPWQVLLRLPINAIRQALSRAISTLVTIMSDRVYFSTETTALRQLCKLQLGIETDVYPLYSTVSNPKATDKSIDFLAIVGSDTEAKSVSEVFANLHLANAGLQLAISTRWGYELPPETEVALKANGVSLKIGTLSDADYEDLLIKSKLALLPYFDDYYKWSSSARLLDSVACNCHVIVPKDSTLSELVEKNYWGFTVNQYDWTLIEKIGRSFVWTSLQVPPNSPNHAAKFLVEQVGNLTGKESNFSGTKSLITPIRVISYLNIGLNSKLVLGRYIDSRKPLRKLSSIVRKWLADRKRLPSSDYREGGRGSAT